MITGGRAMRGSAGRRRATPPSRVGSPPGGRAGGAPRTATAAVGGVSGRRPAAQALLLRLELGVNSAPKSSAAKRGGSSSSPPPSIGFGHPWPTRCLSEGDVQIQKPATRWLGSSAKGPGTTSRLVPRKTIRAAGSRVKALAGLHDAGVYELLVVGHHLGQESRSASRRPRTPWSPLRTRSRAWSVLSSRSAAAPGDRARVRSAGVRAVPCRPGGRKSTDGFGRSYATKLRNVRTSRRSPMTGASCALARLGLGNTEEDRDAEAHHAAVPGPITSGVCLRPPEVLRARGRDGRPGDHAGGAAGVGGRRGGLPRR